MIYPLGWLRLRIRSSAISMPSKHSSMTEAISFGLTVWYIPDTRAEAISTANANFVSHSMATSSGR